jgi:hypothetical protein
MVLHVAGDDDEAAAGTDADVSASPTIAVAARAMRNTRPVAPFIGSLLSDGPSTVPSVSMPTVTSCRLPVRRDASGLQLRFSSCIAMHEVV